MTYEGWTNWETWNVKLWIDNDQASREFWLERASAVRNVRQLAEELRDEHEEHTPTTTGVYADLLNMALREVSWVEIAEAFIEEAAEAEE